MTAYERHYQACIANGCSPALADMLASQQAPGLQTDTRRAAGHGTLRDQLGSQTEDVVKAAQKRGFTPGYNMVYNSNLAQYHGDPLAFCPSHDIASHMKKVAKKRGHALVSDDGKVKVKRREAEQPIEKKVKLAPSLVKSELRKLAKANPEIARAPSQVKRELCRQIVAKHGQR